MAEALAGPKRSLAAVISIRRNPTQAGQGMADPDLGPASAEAAVPRPFRPYSMKWAHRPACSRLQISVAGAWLPSPLGPQCPDALLRPVPCAEWFACAQHYKPFCRWGHEYLGRIGHGVKIRSSHISAKSGPPTGPDGSRRSGGSSPKPGSGPGGPGKFRCPQVRGGVYQAKVHADAAEKTSLLAVSPIL